MKEFFKMMFACLVALFVAGLAWMFLMLVVIGALAAAGEGKPSVPRNAVLVIDLSANISDAPPAGLGEEVFTELVGGKSTKRFQLRKVIGALDAAARDDRIKAVFLHGSVTPVEYGSGYAALLEVRHAIEKFRDSGKPVIAYVVTPTTRDYLLASAASRVVMNPMGLIATPGLSAQVLYFGGAFEKYGVGIQIARAGEYKSAGETFALDHMSAPEREQLTALLHDVWGEFVQAVTESRGLEPGAFQALVDSHGLINAEDALAAGLVDEVKDMPTVLEELKELTGAGADEKTFRQVALDSYIAAREPARPGMGGGSQVAVVYAEGAIVDGEGSPNTVGGDRLARELRKLRHNDDVRAVVLRVNSPGGSAIASEVIRRELVLLHETKPVVVSMGSVAASGGYWISTASDHIFAEPNTITGSIGVIAILPNFQGLAQRFAINIESVDTAQHADIFSLAHPRDPAGMQIIQDLIDEVYGKFLDRVAEARKMDRADVEAIAGGRVWSGADALENGLVDEVGGLTEAIAYAAKLAGIDEYKVRDYPEPRTFLDELLERLENRSTPIAATGPAAEIRRYLAGGLRTLESFNDPQGIYARLPVALELN